LLELTHSVSVKGSRVLLHVRCARGGGDCGSGTVEIVAREVLRKGRLVAIEAAGGAHSKRRVVVLGRSTASLKEGQAGAVPIQLSSRGRSLLAHFKRLHVRIEVLSAERAPSGFVAVLLAKR
jgi:hypothetical protein